jgi:acetate kinase
LGFLGIAVDPARNAGTSDRRIGTAQGPVEVLVVAARENLQIAHEVRRVLAS